MAQNAVLLTTCETSLNNWPLVFKLTTLESCWTEEVCLAVKFSKINLNVKEYFTLTINSNVLH